ncbi:DUF429 domain-containing protein [Cellulomonas oligotrophica]|uniref:Putative RNase H-like nuclease n=1 Tax=Cellulomonas oligotrophica TaxID=931536 RepID=A0A7Y9FF11_9CELL|nr:DUF429 domain-containing protein [Cellulomonas oligotrophica]NYD86095.1 putative RNase H-like nuclease [Cellulomonas oligotrophica]GIG30897.1 hypothetical protein Col01nite_00560 [Cellulomonas oligotrophica]
MTRHVGIDLAWGTTARTGVAVLDEAGRLVHSSSVVTDAQIDDVLAEHVGAAPVVAAIDAPLVVPNATGMREAERLVTRHFGRFSAGAYPANRANPHFDPPRAESLARRHGWATDPGVRPDDATSVAVEVYPHPAMVMLFGLDRVLPYKARRGRDVASRTAAWQLLLDHLDRVAGTLLGLPTSPRWAEIRHAAAAAHRPVDLDRLEDEVDAIVCAYLAWLWHHEPERMVVLGTAADGYIVVPGLPDPHEARSRPTTPRRDPDAARRRAVDAVLAEMPMLTPEAARRLVAIVSVELQA